MFCNGSFAKDGHFLSEFKRHGNEAMLTQIGKRLAFFRKHQVLHTGKVVWVQSAWIGPVQFFKDATKQRVIQHFRLP